MVRQSWIVIAAGAISAAFAAGIVGSGAQHAARATPLQQTPPTAIVADTPSGRPVPRFVSLRFNDVYGRAGPSFEHPILWRYRREGLPMQVIAETDGWRKVRDPDGEEVWVHRRLVHERRMVMVIGVGGRDVALRDAAVDDADAVALVQPGVVFALDQCEPGWCRLDGAAVSGWAPAAALWGVTAEEAF